MARKRKCPDSEHADIPSETFGVTKANKLTKRVVPTSNGTKKAKLQAPDSLNLEDIKAEVVGNIRLHTTKAGSSLQDIDNNGTMSEGDVEAQPTSEAVLAALSRPPPVNSTYVPIPWKGRLGYACLNTYLRTANPPVFSSRTCRIASILEHRHPLQDPSQPEHPIKNRPDKEQPADVARGQRWVESLGLLNAQDIIKMLRWNDKYGIKFMRLSSEMFPFASHEEYGYKLAPFAADMLKSVGRVVAKLGHRVTTHPGQFTQLGSPRKEVVENAIRDLNYHDEMLTLLQLPEQQDRDAVMIIHMGGTFGNKTETLERFRTNYARLSDSVKNRLVLENDDVSWSVHDLLPVCQDLNIPLVLDFHHHNIVFDSTKLREGSLDIMEMFPVIRETWTRKCITQKMHYSEPTATAITAMQRRKHSPRVMTMPPCADDMDLMIEAKDKEQAVFELMKRYQLPGHDLLHEVIPYTRTDENPKPRPTRKKKKSDEEKEEAAQQLPLITSEEIGMGGPGRNVYWPLGKEEWLRPPKRITRPKINGTQETSVVLEAEEAAEDTSPAKVVDKVRKAKRSATKTKQETVVDIPKVEIPKVEKLPEKKGRTRTSRRGQSPPKPAARETTDDPKKRGRKASVFEAVTPKEAVPEIKPMSRSRRKSRAD